MGRVLSHLQPTGNAVALRVKADGSISSMRIRRGACSAEASITGFVKVWAYAWSFAIRCSLKARPRISMDFVSAWLSVDAQSHVLALFLHSASALRRERINDEVVITPSPKELQKIPLTCLKTEGAFSELGELKREKSL